MTFAQDLGSRFCKWPPQPWVALPWSIWFPCGGNGSWAVRLEWIHLVTSNQCRWERLVRPSSLPDEQSMDGWPPHEFVQENVYRLHAEDVASRPGASVRIATNRSALLAWHPHFDPTAVMKIKGMLSNTLRCRLSVQAKEMQICSGGSLPRGGRLPESNGAEARQWWRHLALGGLVWWSTSEATKVHCMEDPEDQATAGAPSSGSRDWGAVDASNALQVAAINHVSRWRDQHGMGADSDFGFAFSTYDHAVAAGGHHLAAAWVTVRAEQLGQLLPEAAALVESQGTVRSSSIRGAGASVAPRAPVQKWALTKRRGVRLHPNPQETPEAIVRRVEVLGNLFLQFGALQPAGYLSKRLEAEWSQACNRLAQRLVTSSEASTISNAIRTGKELSKFMADRERPFPPAHVDLDAFLYDSKAAPAPSRALASMKWLSNQGQLAWDLAGLSAPEATTRKRKKAGQAVLVAPPMFLHLEEKIEACHGVGDPRWTALLASWMSAAGCLRYKHIVRSSPRKLSKSTMHCTCSKGKQKRLRKGFSYCIPAQFSTGWPWGQHWFKLYERLDSQKKTSCGLCFDPVGTPWHFKEITEATRELFADQVERPGDLTSYSWRRWGPSVAHLLAFTPERLAALGDWQDRKHVSAETNMPLHYSGVRYTQSLKAKHAVLGAMSFFGGYEDWDMIPASVVMEAREAEVALIDKAVSQDQAVLWALPMSATEIREPFQLTTALKSKAALLRQQSGGTHVARTMPASIAGRTMSDHMKDGSALCAAFQEGRCGRLPEECKGKHRCAAVLRSGRVCGGNHHGQDCRDPRVLKADVPEVPAQPDPSQKPPEPKHPPRKKARTKLPIQEDPPAVELTPAEQALEDRYDMWATRKDRTAQRPSPIWTSPQGGTLWLSGLPTKETVARFPPATLQISCFPQPVAAKRGVLLPRSINMTVAPSKQKVRDSQWRLAWPVMKTSLQSGEDVLLHCVAGKHRAAGIAVLAVPCWLASRWTMRRRR